MDMEKIWKQYEAKIITEGLEDVKAGRTVDADTVFYKVREKYCLSPVYEENQESHTCQGKTLDKGEKML